MSERVPRVGVIGIPGAWSSEALADAVAERTGFRLLIPVEQVCFDTEARSVMWGEQDLCALDGLIVKKVGTIYGAHLLDRLEILRYVAGAGVRVFSAPEAVLRVVDRLACTVTLAGGGIRMPPTVVTEQVEQAVDAIRRFGAAVLKPLYSTKARGMCVVEADDGDALVEQVEAFKSEGNPLMYVQQRISIPERDLGVVFLGGNYVGTYARVKHEESWNTTIHHGGRYESHEPDTATVELAFNAQRLFGLDFTSVDVAETADGPVVFEVSAFGGFRGLRDGLGLRGEELYADYVLATLGVARE